jgi:hypothetical protein
MYQDNMMMAAAALFWARVHAIGPAPPPAVAPLADGTALRWFNAAMGIYRGSSALRDRCGTPSPNWDNGCPHAMLLLVQVCLLPTRLQNGSCVPRANGGLIIVEISSVVHAGVALAEHG